MTLSDLAKYSMIRSVTRSLRQLSFLLFMLLEVDHGVIRSTSTGDVTANRRNMTNLLTVAMLRLSAIKIIQTKSRIIASVAYFRILVGGGRCAACWEGWGWATSPENVFFCPQNDKSVSAFHQNWPRQTWFPLLSSCCLELTSKNSTRKLENNRFQIQA